MKNPKVEILKVVRVSPSWKVQKMITVGKERSILDPKYKRYYKKKSTRKAHYPFEQKPEVGEEVWVKECRPISASKKHIAWLKR